MTSPADDTATSWTSSQGGQEEEEASFNNFNLNNSISNFNISNSSSISNSTFFVRGLGSQMAPPRPKNRNSNMLSAILCLIKEIDGPSLEVVELAARCRMEEL